MIELSRLLSTAKSKDRKELIKTALNKLDNNIGGNEDRFDYDSHTLNTTLSTGNLSHSSLFAPVHSELAINTTTNSYPLSYKQQMMRPMSARRRPSTPSLLDAIPEVVRVLGLNYMLILLVLIVISLIEPNSFQ